MNLELTLYEVSTGDSLTKDGYELLHDMGYVESKTEAPDGRYFAKLTPKGDKLIRDKLSDK